MEERARLPDALTAIAIAMLILASAPTAMGGGQDLGEYVQDASIGDLTDDHVQDAADGFTVAAPTGTDEVRVSTAYVEERVGDFAADHAFTLDGDRVVAATASVTFTTFSPGPDPVFTEGSDASLRFLDRPMWVSVEAIENDIVIHADDGDTTGQQIRVAKAWLAEYGVSAPLFVHEDGTVLDWTEDTAGGAYVVEVHHFSDIIIPDPTLDDSWRSEGFTVRYDFVAEAGSGQFNMTVSNTSGDTISFRFWDTVNGTQTVLDEKAFTNTTRANLNESEYFSFSYINETNLENLLATLGFDDYELTELTTTSYVLTRGNLSYHYDLDQGWLRKVVDSGNGTSLEVYAWGTGGSYPQNQEGPLSPVCVADLTAASNGLNVEASYVEDTDSVDASAEIGAWSGGDPDERCETSVLAPSTVVTVEGDWLFEIWVDTDSQVSQSCFATGCNAMARMGGGHELYVAYPNGGQIGPLEEINCVDDCTYDDVRKEWNAALRGVASVTDTVDHGLNGNTEVFPFWFCGQPKVWDADGDLRYDDANCTNPASSKPTEPENGQGNIIVEPRLLPSL